VHHEVLRVKTVLLFAYKIKKSGLSEFKGVPLFHEANEDSSEYLVNLSSGSASTGTTQAMTTAAVVNGIYESSFLTLEYTDQVDSTNFVITSKTGTTSNVYFAFGLSDDFDQMVNNIILKINVFN